MKIQTIADNKLLEMLKLSSICFDYPFQTNGKSEEEYLKQLKQNPPSKARSPLSKTIGAFTDKEELMSGLSLISYEFYFDGKPQKGTGIGDVVTYPHHRRKGAIREIFNYALPHMYREGHTFSYLYPFSESFYNRFGYHRLNNSICWELDLSMIPDYNYDGSFHLYGMDASLEDFSTAYESFASQYNMMVKRDQYDWDNLTAAKGCFNNNYAYLYKDRDGIPCGYLIFKREVRNGAVILNCREMVYYNFTVLKALLSFVRTYSADFKSIRLHSPSVLNMDHFCRDFTCGHTSVTHALNGMIRVVNAENALLSAAYRGSSSFTVLLTDPQIAENNGKFTVCYKDGAAEKILRSKEDQTVDCKMNIDLFSAALAGNFNAYDFKWIDGFESYCNEEKLSEIFYKKPGWINNYF